MHVKRVGKGPLIPHSYPPYLRFFSAFSMLSAGEIIQTSSVYYTVACCLYSIVARIQQYSHVLTFLPTLLEIFPSFG